MFSNNEHPVCVSAYKYNIEHPVCVSAYKYNIEHRCSFTLEKVCIRCNTLKGSSL